MGFLGDVYNPAPPNTFGMTIFAYLECHVINCICYIFCLESPSPDEVEAYVVLQECLEMRKRYIFREAIAPWEKEVISDPSTPKPNPDPFLYTSEGKSDVSFFSVFENLDLPILYVVIKLLVYLLFYSITLKCKMGSFMYIQTEKVSKKGICYRQTW